MDFPSLNIHFGIPPILETLIYCHHFHWNILWMVAKSESLAFWVLYPSAIPVFTVFYNVLYFPIVSNWGFLPSTVLNNTFLFLCCSPQFSLEAAAPLRRLAAVLWSNHSENTSILAVKMGPILAALGKKAKKTWGKMGVPWDFVVPTSNLRPLRCLVAVSDQHVAQQDIGTCRRD